ncbi:hypothetical protein Clacol_009471 [Clathrus columnatus]|uniref:Uncharacterized protein n=1 Tax=Clathrus columnatus TaxID=1419009 RepID=A0AAV5AL93_9AGAM|nr:hypothetical protein Clacol_009471 [Clathrus columnatus]
MDLNRKEFEIHEKIPTARCRLCPRSKWVNYSNARSHARTAKHQELAKKKYDSVTERVLSTRATQKVTINDNSIEDKSKDPEGPELMQEIEAEGRPHVSNIQHDSAPYPSKAMILTKALLNSPSLRFSEDQKEAILWWGRGVGIRDVPTLEALQRVPEVTNFDPFGDPTE